MEQLAAALYTGAGMLWKALWALVFGFISSACSFAALAASRSVLANMGPESRAECNVPAATQLGQAFERPGELSRRTHQKCGINFRQVRDPFGCWVVVGRIDVVAVRGGCGQKAL